MEIQPQGITNLDDGISFAEMFEESLQRQDAVREGRRMNELYYEFAQCQEFFTYSR